MISNRHATTSARKAPASRFTLALLSSMILAACGGGVDDQARHQVVAESGPGAKALGVAMNPNASLSVVANQKAVRANTTGTAADAISATFNYNGSLISQSWSLDPIVGAPTIGFSLVNCVGLAPPNVCKTMLVTPIPSDVKWPLQLTVRNTLRTSLTTLSATESVTLLPSDARIDGWIGKGVMLGSLWGSNALVVTGADTRTFFFYGHDLDNVDGFVEGYHDVLNNAHFKGNWLKRYSFAEPNIVASAANDLYKAGGGSFSLKGRLTAGSVLGELNTDRRNPALTRDHNPATMAGTFVGSIRTAGTGNTPLQVGLRLYGNGSVAGVLATSVERTPTGAGYLASGSTSCLVNGNLSGVTDTVYPSISAYAMGTIRFSHNTPSVCALAGKAMEMVLVVTPSTSFRERFVMGGRTSDGATGAVMQLERTGGL